MWEFSVFRALGLMVRTLPFLLFRSAVCLTVAAALALAAGAGATAGRLLEGEGPGFGAQWGAAAGLLLGLLLLSLRRGRFLHRITAGQLALLTEVLDRRKVPFSPAQIGHAAGLVAERVGDSSRLLALDRLVLGVIRTATGLVDGLLEGLLPVSILDRLARATGLHLFLALGLVKGVVLAHALRTRSENAWEAAHDGLVLYTQNARPILGTALWLSLLGWLIVAVVAVAALPTAGTVAALMPGLPGAQPLLAILFAGAVKAALYDPFAQACLLQLHLRLTEAQEPLPEWRGRLTQVSDKFRLLGERALGWTPGAAQDM